MVITSKGPATFVVTSDTHTAAEVSNVLGLEPTESHEAGWVFGRGRVRDYSWWMLEGPESSGEEEHRLTSITRLADLLDGKAEAIASLSQDDRYDVRINWFANSDSYDGGFVMPADLLAKLGPLGRSGVYILGDIFLDTPDTFWSRLRFAFGRS